MMVFALQVTCRRHLSALIDLQGCSALTAQAAGFKTLSVSYFPKSVFLDRSDQLLADDGRTRIYRVIKFDSYSTLKVCPRTVYLAVTIDGHPDIGTAATSCHSEKPNCFLKTMQSRMPCSRECPL